MRIADCGFAAASSSDRRSAVPDSLPSSPGTGSIVLRRVAGRTVPVRLQFDSPLRLLAPKTHGDAAWIFAGTYGGGLVRGDDIRLSVDVGPGAVGLLGTQASTKVYRSDGRVCRQQLDATVGKDALLVSAPDPVVCFAGSRYEQSQRFELDVQAAMVSIDIFTSGRCSRGERWAMNRYQSRTEVIRGGRCIFRDAIRLDPADGPIDAAMRMGRCDCFASMLIIGDRFREVSAAVAGFINSAPLSGPTLCAATPIDAGIIVRVAGHSTETVAAWLRQRLTFLIDPLGGDPWSRRW